MLLLFWTLIGFFFAFKILKYQGYHTRSFLGPLLLICFSNLNNIAICFLAPTLNLGENSIYFYSSLQGFFFLTGALALAYNRMGLSGGLGVFMSFALIMTLFAHSFFYVRFGGT